MVCRGVGNINNYTYKKLRIIQSYPQPIFKASTNSHRLRNSCARLLRGELHSNSPRLWNLYLALSKGLTAKKIELYGVFYFPPRHCYKRLVLCRYIYNCLCCQRGRKGGGVAATFIQILKTVVRIGHVALDKSVPTPLPLRRYLRHINR